MHGCYACEDLFQVAALGRSTLDPARRQPIGARIEEVWHAQAASLGLPQRARFAKGILRTFMEQLQQSLARTNHGPDAVPLDHLGPVRHGVRPQAPEQRLDLGMTHAGWAARRASVIRA